MGIFFSEVDGIDYPHLKKLLGEIPHLDSGEREYVLGVLDQYEQGGVTKGELEKAVRNLKLDSNDTIDAFEAEAIKKKLMSFFEEKK